MGSKTQTANTQQTSTPVNQAALNQIYGQVQSAASTPYTPYNGELVAGINGQQTTGIGNINTAANQAQPYYTQAGTLASGASNPLTASQIQNYQNPYTQQVVNATQAQFNDQNAQAQSALKGSVAQQGALGGDRQAVAQAVLAGQQQTAQAPVIAGLESQGYNNAVTTAEQQYQQNPLAAASALGSIGSGAQNAALTGANAQINAGTLQQQTQQAQDTANYGQYQAAQGFPYQEAAFLEQYGLPAALGQGSVSNGTQNTQGPSSVAPYLGAAVSAAGLFAKDGGPIHKASGGPSYITAPDYITAGAGYIPMGQPSQSTLQAPSLSYLKPNSTSSSTNPFSGTGGANFASGLQNDFGSASFGGGSILSGDAWGGDKNNPLEGLSASDYGYAAGGLVKAIHGIHQAIRRSRGGSVTASNPFAAFDDGGDVSFPADRFSPAVDAPFADMSRGQAIHTLAVQNGATLAPDSIPGGEPAPVSNPDNVINPDNPFRMPSQDAVQAWRDDAPNPATAANPVALPPQITNPDNTPTPDTTALAYNTPNNVGPIGANGMPTVIAPVSHPDNEQHFGHSLFGTDLSDKTRQALFAAGLGIMASRSPFLGNAIGEGGLAGLKNLSETNKAEQEAADKQLTHEQEAQRIANQAYQYTRSQNETERHNKAAEDKDFKPQLVNDTDPSTGETRHLLFDPNTRKLTGLDAPVNAATASNTSKFTSQAPPVEERRKAPAASPEARDESYYKWMQDNRPPGYADIVKGVADYEIDPNREASLQKGARDRLYRDVKLYDPTYDQTHFGEKQGVIASFSRGQDRAAVNSLNVSVAHLATLQQLGDALQNGNVPLINRLGNQIAIQLGRAAPTNFDAAKEIVGDEVVKAVVGGVNSQADREAVKHLIMAQQSPEQLKGVIQTFVSLLGGQLEGRRQGYQAGTGLNNFDDKYLSPATREALKASSINPHPVGADIQKAVYPSGIPTNGGATPSSKPSTVTQNGHTYTLQPDGSYK